VRFPKRIKHRGKVLATVYGKTKGGKPKKNGGVTEPYPFYRVCAYVAGKRRMTSYHTYSEAKKAADTLVRDLAKGSQAAALTHVQALDALAALERLRAFENETGRRVGSVSLLSAVSELAEAAKNLNGYTLREAVEGFMGSVVSVKRVTLEQAIEDFIAFRKTKTIASNGRKPQLSEDHWRNTRYWLREFAKTFPATWVCDLKKAHLDKYMTAFAKFAPKTRNERRGVVKMFLAWAVKQDYLAPTHRLLEASHLEHENADVEVIECYSASELRRLLERASKQPELPKEGQEPEADYRPLPAVLALAGLAGLREKEVLRLDWQDVWRVPGHIEVGALKSKTRSRRLVEICASLSQWQCNVAFGE